MMAPNKTTDQERLAHMQAALRLASRGLGRAWPNPAVGCVLVRDDLKGKIVGRGWTQPGGRPHAETEALRRAGQQARGSTAYISLEPCDHHGQTGPCSQALIDAGVASAFIAAVDPDPRVAGRGIDRLLAGKIKVNVGMLEDEAKRLNHGFFLKITKKRPMFTLKLATGLNGRIPATGLNGKDAKSVTGPLARQRGHLLRARHDGVLFGVGTIIDDDPQYTCRLPGMINRSPLRILLDSCLRLSKESNLLKTINISPLLIITAKAAAKTANLPGAKIINAAKINEKGHPDPWWVAFELARLGLTRILIESGPRVAGAFMSAGLVDRISWFKSPSAVAGGIDAVQGFDLTSLTNGRQFVQTSVVNVDGDILENYERLG